MDRERTEWKRVKEEHGMHYEPCGPKSGLNAPWAVAPTIGTLSDVSMSLAPIAEVAPDNDQEANTRRKQIQGSKYKESKPSPHSMHYKPGRLQHEHAGLNTPWAAA